MKKFYLICICLGILFTMVGCSTSESRYYMEYADMNTLETDVKDWFSIYEKDGIYFAKNEKSSILYVYVKSNIGQDKKFKNYNVGVQINNDELSLFTEIYTSELPSERVLVIYLDGQDLESIIFNDEEILIEQIESIK